MKSTAQGWALKRAPANCWVMLGAYQNLFFELCLSVIFFFHFQLRRDRSGIIDHGQPGRYEHVFILASLIYKIMYSVLVL